MPCSKSDDLVISERHLGLVPSNEFASGRAHIDRMAKIIRDQVDLQTLRALAPARRCRRPWSCT